MKPDYFQISEVSPSCLKVEVIDVDRFTDHSEKLRLGSYLKVTDTLGNSLVAVVTGYAVKDTVECKNGDIQPLRRPRVVLEAQPLALIDSENLLHRNSQRLTLPPAEVELAGSDILERLYSQSPDLDTPFSLGPLSVMNDVPYVVDGNRLFGKHIAVVGSTGSGKSCTVASLLQKAVKLSDEVDAKNNSHIIIFDPHAEYAAAFKFADKREFSFNVLDTSNLKLPYWLMNSEELESMFIESNESNSHNQISIFKQAVIANKRRHNRQIEKMTYDAPVYFSLQEVVCFIDNLNREVLGKLLEDDGRPKVVGEESPYIEDQTQYFDRRYTFVPTSTAKADKASNGPFHGEFTRFLSRLENRLDDNRLQFLLSPKREDGQPFSSDDATELIKQFIGYRCKSNVTVIDLSGIPFEILSITVSLISRLVFDFCFHYTKLKHKDGGLNNIPVLLVCEEAHQYVPRTDSAAYRASRKSIERVAKEGRKYGMNLMVVSQRPSEVSETIFAQCSNFLALRLTNYADQAYVRRLLPDNSHAVTESLPALAPGECLVMGDLATLPAVVQIEMPEPIPQSAGVNVHSEWKQNWRDVDFETVVGRWLNLDES